MKQEQKKFGVFTVSDLINGNVEANMVPTGKYYKTEAEAKAAADAMFHEDWAMIPQGFSLGYNYIIRKV